MTLLTIAIPTYNGADTIRETLDSILSQTKNLNENVWVVISDNNSTDETSTISQKYHRNYPNVLYFKNPENIGFDRNYDLAIRRSPGEYVWTICDDDIIKPGAIQKILDILHKVQDISNIFVNCSVYDSDLKICKTERVANIYDDIICYGADLFYATTVLASLLASSHVISRELWMGTNMANAFGSGWIHFDIISRIKLHHPRHRSYCIAEPLVMIRRGETVRWSHEDNLGKTLLEKGLDLLEIVNRMKSQGHSNECVNQLRSAIASDLLSTIIFARISGFGIDFPLMKRMYRIVDKPVLVLGVYFPLMVIPRVFLQYPTQIVRDIKSNNLFAITPEKL